jgi:hypothetical protein
MSNVTIVTAFFDINREKNGDGRKLNEYLEWIQKTLQLNCNLFIFTENKFIEFMNINRPLLYKDKTYIIEDTLQNTSYYKYIDKMKEILNDENYKKRIEYPDRVECKLPEYNIIQYSKFGWLEEAIRINPFNSDYFFWMDIGISRFFYNINIKNPYPSDNKINQLFTYENKNKFIIQQRKDLQNYNIDENFIWKSDNLLKGGMFGGNKDCIIKISNLLNETLQKYMLEKKNVNNEQLCLALIWKEKPELFYLIDDNDSNPCKVLHILYE